MHVYSFTIQFYHTARHLIFADFKSPNIMLLEKLKPFEIFQNKCKIHILSEQKVANDKKNLVKIINESNSCIQNSHTIYQFDLAYKNKAHQNFIKRALKKPKIYNHFHQKICENCNQKIVSVWNIKRAEFLIKALQKLQGKWTTLQNTYRKQIYQLLSKKLQLIQTKKSTISHSQKNQQDKKTHTTYIHANIQKTLVRMHACIYIQYSPLPKHIINVQKTAAILQSIINLLITDIHTYVNISNKVN
eukprot:TRINITY_DN25061_c0_g4_i1.p1 TRINITY_DN25061_c0_g4~~TRINITY_DN25061_c0_g4_i1.p1  ORF type:complete len:276 (-),score=-20.73 TRINITY_DN25061_c0_g4_i1:445-1182(-)